MPMLLKEVAAELDKLVLSAPVQSSAMQVAYARFAGTTPTFQLHDMAQLGLVTTPWAPNVFRGTGQEHRVTATFNVSDSIREDMELVEERLRDILRPSVPKIDSLWHGCTKPGDKFRSTLRSKINLFGNRMAKFVDREGNPVDPPTSWHGLSVLPVLTLRGVYIQKTGAGVMMEVVALMIGEAQGRREEEIKFR
jgi:hypothetical protein